MEAHYPYGSVSPYKQLLEGEEEKKGTPLGDRSLEGGFSNQVDGA